jgi:adenylate cyclase
MLWSSARHIPEALRLAEQAIERDPYYGPALAWTAYCYVALLHGNQSGSREADRRKAIDFARRALQVAGDDPGVLANAAYALAYFGEDIRAMMALVDRALALNPSFARGWYISGVIKLWAGQPAVAIERVEALMHLSPRAPVGPALGIIGGAHFCAQRFYEAVPKLLLAIQEDSKLRPAVSLSRRLLHAYGQLEDAREIVNRLRAITPVVIADASYLRNAEHRELGGSTKISELGQGEGEKRWLEAG